MIHGITKVMDMTHTCVALRFISYDSQESKGASTFTPAANQIRDISSSSEQSAEEALYKATESRKSAQYSLIARPSLTPAAGMLEKTVARPPGPLQCSVIAVVQCS
jgi:hypothetical protein